MAYINKETGVKSRRDSDEIKEKKLRALLDKIYRLFGLTFERITCDDIQVKGVDVEMKLPGKITMRIDEKATIFYVTSFSSLGSFAFEISGKNYKDNTGWLYDYQKRTTYYALIYVNTTDDFDTLDAAEILIVSRQSIWDLLYCNGIAGVDDAEDMIAQKGYVDRYHKTRCRVNDAISLVRSNQLAEQPLNAIIDRDILRWLATYRIVYRNPKSKLNIPLWEYESKRQAA